MSLATRLTALAQAVGADIKQLRADAATVPKSFSFYIASAQSLGAGNPVNWTGETIDTDNLRSGSGVTSIVLPAGTWWIEASLRPDSALTSGAYLQGLLHVNGVIRSEGIGVQQAGATTPRCNIPGVPVISDGTTTIQVIVSSNTSGGTFPAVLGATGGCLVSGTIAGGPRGVQGPKGDSSGLLASASLAAVTTYDISGLNGDTDGAYRVILDGIFTPPDGVYRGVVVKPNAVTLAGVPLVIHEWAYSGGTAGHSISAGGTNNFATGFTIGGSTYAPLLTHGRMEAVIMAKTGRRRVSRSAQSYRTSDGLKYGGRDLVSVWDDTTTVINSLRIDFGGLSFTGDMNLLLANRPNP